MQREQHDRDLADAIAEHDRIVAEAASERTRREAEWARQEADIFAALREGRRRREAGALTARGSMRRFQNPTAERFIRL